MADTLVPFGTELADIRQQILDAVPGATVILVASRRPIQGAPWDVVAAARYRVPGDMLLDPVPSRWAVVQRVGFQWTATVNLDVETARTLALSIARRERDGQPT